jgi:hypothetical protein
MYLYSKKLLNLALKTGNYREVEFAISKKTTKIGSIELNLTGI